MLRLSMRVLTVGNMYPPHHLGGYELVWRGAVDHMRAVGHDVTVLTTTTRLAADAGPDGPGVHRSLRWYWDDHAFRPMSWREAVAIERADRRTLDEHLAGGVDALLWWSMGGLPMGLLAAPGPAGIPSGAVVHDAWPAYGPRVDARTGRGGRAAPLLTLAGRLAGLPPGDPLRAVDAWSFNSAWLRDELAGRVPAIAGARAASRVDPPGIDHARLRPAPPRPWSGRIAAVGRLDERKGLRYAVEALGQLPEASLVITGSGDARVAEDLRALARTLGVADRVDLAGASGDVREAYADADVVVFPVTWDEPFGLVPLEAMSVGRPVVATATGGAAEYLRDEGNALVVPVADPDALARAVRRLATDAALREALVSEGRRTASTRSATRFEAAITDFARDVAGTAA